MEFGEGVFCDLGGDKGVSVAVATNPAGEAELGVGFFFAEIFDIPSGVFPGEFKRAVEA